MAPTLETTCEDGKWRALARRDDPVEVMQYCPACPYLEVEIPDTVKMISRLTIITVSHDQGFSGTEESLKGTYDGSMTWFEATVISGSNHERAPSRNVQRNINASSETRRHENAWDIAGDDDDIRRWLASIRGGDTVQLIPRAEFPAWVNYVYEAELLLEGELLPYNEPNSATSVRSIADYYQPLNLGARETRLLTLHPGKLDDPLSCSLVTTSLEKENHTSYEAISYCWGDTKDMRTIALVSPQASPQQRRLTEDDIEYQVDIAVSLHDALKSLRHESTDDRVVWVDALCINQSDIEERSQQVSLMRTIYSCADRVIVWLGLESPASQDCFKEIRTIASRYEMQYDPIKSSQDRDELVRLHEPMVYDDLLPFVDKWRRCDFGWFRRTWVLQEVANAKEATVQCGYDSLPWPVVLRLADCMVKAKQLTNLFRYSLMPPVFSRLFRLNGPGPVDVVRSQNLGILDMLIGGHDLDATDPRDKIFALLQFGSETSDVEKLPDSIRPDYSKSAVEAYVDFTRWWITTHKSLRILSAVHTTRGREWQKMTPNAPPELSALGRPTWCFWHGGAASWAKATLGLQEDGKYRATGSATPDLDLLSEPSLPATTLRLAGHRLCVIDAITRYPLYDGPDATLRPIPALLGPYHKIFDPIAESRTWVWPREDHKPRPRPLEDVMRAYHEHLMAHFAYAAQTGGSLPCLSPCFFRSEEDEIHGQVGFCPYSARVGDIVVVLYGGQVPYVLRERKGDGQTRQSGAGNTYEFVGECLLLDYMEGRAVAQSEAGELAKEVFDLV